MHGVDKEPLLLSFVMMLALHQERLLRLLALHRLELLVLVSV